MERGHGDDCKEMLCICWLCQDDGSGLLKCCLRVVSDDINLTMMIQEREHEYLKEVTNLILPMQRVQAL